MSIIDPFQIGGKNTFVKCLKFRWKSTLKMEALSTYSNRIIVFNFAYFQMLDK